MYNLLLYTSKMQEDKLYNIYIVLDIMNNSILLLCWSCCIVCMPMACHWVERRPVETEGNL